MNPDSSLLKYLPLILLIGAAGVAYLIVHSHVTAATLKTKLEGLASQVGLVHTAAAAPVAVALVPVTPAPTSSAAPATSAAAAPPAAAAAPAAAPAAPAGPVVFDPAQGLAAFQALRAKYPIMTSFVSPRGYQIDVRGQEIIPEAPVAFDPVGWGKAIGEHYDHTFNDATPATFETVVTAGAKAMACGAGYTSDVTPVITAKADGRVLATGYGQTFTVDADTPVIVTVTPNKVPAGCSINLVQSAVRAVAKAA